MYILKVLVLLIRGLILQAVVTYQKAQGNWETSGSGSTPYTQENPYFYNNGTSNSTYHPVPDGGTTTSSPNNSGPTCSGMDARWDTVTATGSRGMMTFCACPTWMTGKWTGIAKTGSGSYNYTDYSNLWPPLSKIAVDEATLSAYNTANPGKVPTYLLNLCSSQGNLRFIDYWNYLVYAAVLRYCIPTSAFLTQGTAGGSALTIAGIPCTMIQVWNEYKGIDWVSGTIGSNNFNDTSFNEQVTGGVTNVTHCYDWAQLAWLYGNTYQAITAALTSAGYTRQQLGLQICGPYLSMIWNYYDPVTGVVRNGTANWPVDTSNYYYRVFHLDQKSLAQFMMFRSGTGNAYPTPGPGITQRSGTIPQWTPSSGGADKGSAQNIPIYQVDVLNFDGLQRYASDPGSVVGSSVNNLPNNFEPSRTINQWMAQQLIDTARYQTAHQDLLQLAVNCGLNIPIGQAENYFDYTLDTGNSISGSETVTGPNNFYYATHQYQACVIGSAWLNMLKGGCSYCLRWQPEGLFTLNKITDGAGSYYPEYSYQGNCQSLWPDTRNLSAQGISPIGTSPNKGAPYFGGYYSGDVGYTGFQAYPTFTVFKAFHDYFSLNTSGHPVPYYDGVITDFNLNPLTFGLEVLDNAYQIMVINKDTISHSITFLKPNGSYVGVPDLQPYEVRIITMYWSG